MCRDLKLVTICPNVNYLLYNVGLQIDNYKKIVLT